MRLHLLWYCKGKRMRNSAHWSLIVIIRTTSIVSITNFEPLTWAKNVAYSILSSWQCYEVDISLKLFRTQTQGFKVTISPKFANLKSSMSGQSLQSLWSFQYSMDLSVNPSHPLQCVKDHFSKKSSHLSDWIPSNCCFRSSLPLMFLEQLVPRF